MSDHHMERLKTLKSEIDSNLNEETPITTFVDEERMRLDVRFMGHEVVVTANYNFSFMGFSSVFSRTAHWKDAVAAVKSLKRKIRSLKKERDAEEARLVREAKLEELNRETLAKAEAKFGGQAKCVVGSFRSDRGLFGNRLKFTEEQLMHFLEHNKDFIDENGRWKGVDNGQG